ncbi:MAG TPA: cyclopropane-fatty-acyl-phospholipid synthase family protein, partial [Caulobacteraceae bacterium]
RVRVRVSDKAAREILRKRGLGLGEVYKSGDLSFERGDIAALLALVGRNPTGPRARPGPIGRGWRALLRLKRQWNDRNAARANVHHHYDLSYDLYRSFLDADMQYSCAYFPRPGMTLDQAQAAKKAHIIAKLRLAPGQRVLDIGCGWGGLGLQLAADHGVRVTGVTLSSEQLAVARRRAADAHIEDRAKFALADYRDLSGPFDRIVSVGMFEHVGAPNYRAFFEKVRSLLTDDGVAVIHSIGRMDGPGVTDPFIRKYIFPGGYIPALSQVTTAVEQAGLWITDIEVLRLHYAETLRHWRERFLAARETIAGVYDQRFCRMWECYLAASEMGFRHAGLFVFQIQLARRVDAVPVVRDYMVECEAALDHLPTPVRRSG